MSCTEAKALPPSRRVTVPYRKQVKRGREGVACAPWHLFVGIVLLHSASAVIMPCSIHALSVSKNGFVALLMDRPRERLLPLVVAEDRVRSGTQEALTLLQLLQGIDLGGPAFPPELLEQRVGSNSRLRHVIVSTLDAAILCLQDAESEGVPCPSMFEAVALSMRYRVPILAEAALLDEHAISLTLTNVRYPNSFTALDAIEQRTAIAKRMAGLPADSTGSPPQGLSESAMDIRSFFGRSVDERAPDPQQFPQPIAKRLNANAAPPGMLLKVLDLARARGDTAAVQKIEERIRIEQLKQELDPRA